MSKRLLLLILSLTLVTSCGFKLRGNFEMSEAISQISIEGGTRDLVELITELLNDSGSTVVPAESGVATLLITRSDYERLVRDKDADGLATGYDYEYNVDFNVVDADGIVLLPASSITQLRTLNFDPTELLENEEEEEFLREEMEKEIVLQILRRLSRI